MDTATHITKLCGKNNTISATTGIINIKTQSKAFTIVIPNSYEGILHFRFLFPILICNKQTP